jgi:hypothetical protein
MDYTTLIATLRAAHRTIPFDDPIRGAAVLGKLSHGLPASEALKQLSPAERAIAAVRRTIRHSHEARGMADPWGQDTLVVFLRHVIEGTQRWDFTVAVAVDRDHHAAITEVRVVRPGDDLPDQDAGRAEPAAVPRPTTGLSTAELLPFGMLACPCCGHATLSERGGYQICPVCFWEDDGRDTATVDRVTGPNDRTLREARVSYARTGACDDAAARHVRRPTAEEIPLRRFTDDGTELTG